MTVKLSESTVELASKLQVSIDPKTKLPVVAEKDVYQTLLAPRVEIEKAKELKAFDTEITAAGVLALGDAISEYAKKHKKDLPEEFSLTLPTIGRDTIEFTWKKTTNSINPRTKEEVIRYGNISAKHNVFAANNKAGQLGAARAHVSEDHASWLAD